MGGKHSRNKGHQFERDVAKRFRDIFPGARRKLEYQEADCTGVDITGTGVLKIQCKRYRQYSPISKIEEIRESGIRCLVTKGDRSPTMICLELDDFINILSDIGVVYENDNSN